MPLLLKLWMKNFCLNLQPPFIHFMELKMFDRWSSICQSLAKHDWYPTKRILCLLNIELLNICIYIRFNTSENEHCVIYGCIILCTLMNKDRKNATLSFLYLSIYQSREVYMSGSFVNIWRCLFVNIYCFAICSSR